MRELLERVAKVMPEGWILSQANHDTSAWELHHVDDCRGRFDGGAVPLRTYRMELDGYYSDLSLAPLTALLKQELAGCRGWNEGEVLVHKSRIGWGVYAGLEIDGSVTGNLCENKATEDEDDHVYDPRFQTEFEAVATAYLSLKEQAQETGL